jgi:hypothetical protein
MAKIRQEGMGCPVHTGSSGAPCPVRHLRKLERLLLTASTRGAYGYNSPDCPVGRPRQSRRSQEKFNGVQLKFTGLFGEPTVNCATVDSVICGRHVARTDGQKGHRTVRCAPDCPVCTGQCPVRQPMPELQQLVAPN